MILRWKDAICRYFLNRWNQQKKSQHLVGLEIGSDSLKLLEINSTNKINILEKFSIKPLPADAVVKDEIKNYAVISEILKEMFKESGITTKQVALSIPRSLAIIKTILVDKRLNADEIESRTWIEANHHFPDLIGNIYLDSYIVGPSAQDPTQLELILVACRKEQIKPYLEVLNLAGLKAKIMDVNCYALERALTVIAQNFPHLKTIAMFNLNFTLSSFIVVHESHQVYAHDQGYDGKRLKLQSQEYIKNKSNENLIDDTDYINILKENLGAHLRHMMHFFYSSRPNVNVQQIILSGDCAVIPGLAAFIQKEIGIPTMVADLFSNMQLAAALNKEDLKKYTPTLALVFGLALSKF